MHCVHLYKTVTMMAFGKHDRIRLGEWTGWGETYFRFIVLSEHMSKIHPSKGRKTKLGCKKTENRFSPRKSSSTKKPRLGTWFKP